MNRDHAVAVAGVVVRDDGRVLAAQRRDDGRWEPPGGHLEPGERFEDEAAARMPPAFAARVLDAVRPDGAPASRAHDGHHLLP